jgi:ankyrin repeat protein
MEEVSCANCNKKSTQGEFKRCSGCKDEFYCSEDCQKIAWKQGHKKLCKTRTEQNAKIIQQSQQLDMKSVQSLLLKHGGDSPKHDEQGKTALHGACIGGHPRCVSLLLDHDRTLVDKACGVGGYTAAYFASQYGHVQCLSLLIEYGSDVSRPSNNNSTPAFVAIQCNQIKCLSLLLQQETVDINKVGYNNMTLLQIARQYGRSEIIDLLLEKGAVDSDVAAPELTEQQKEEVKDVVKYGRTLRKEAKHCDYPECKQGKEKVPPELLKKCSLCMVVSYCCEEHQKLHWKEHKPLCKQYRL